VSYHYRLTGYAAAYVTTTIVSLIVAAAVHRRRPARGSGPLALLMVAIAWWSLAYALDVAAVDLGAKIMWSKVEYIGSNAASVMMLLFALHYVGHERWLRPWRLLLLWVPPLVNMAMAATNELHGLLWTGFSSGMPGSNLVIFHHGPWFWVVVASAYGYLATASIVLITAVVRRPKIWHTQAASLLVATVVPWAGSLVYVLDLSPFLGFDFTPLGFVFSGLILWFSMSRYGLLDLVPVARDLLMEGMEDGVLVLDGRRRVVDHNPAALIALSAQPDVRVTSLIGRQASELLSPWPAWLSAYDAGTGSHVEVAIGTGTAARVYDVRTSRIGAVGTQTGGYLSVMRDVTDQAIAQQRLRESEDRFRLIATNMPFPFVLSTLSGDRVLYANEKARDLFGVEADGGRLHAPLAYYRRPADRVALADDLARNGFAKSRQILFQRDSGELFWALVSAVMTRYGDQEALLSGITDISEHKQAEAEHEALIAQLQEALASIKTLRGLVPICANCKKIRDDMGYWQQLEEYISQHSEAQFTHGICPECMAKLYGYREPPDGS